MNHSFRVLSLSLGMWLLSCAGVLATGKYNYETVPDDPLKARIHTLPNGLKVYLTVNKETPRIQTYIAVRVGGKNDPAETTGLAHYFEHLMFKGTKEYGTMNYEAEKPLLDRIEETFELYRQTTREEARKALYRTIDSLSYEASKFAIPNEYDKLMSAIGATGTNAYTSFDVTCYTEDIPSNEIENWAKIQADRFKYNVIRGFHTELETVYEEKNMSLTRDPRKVYEATLNTLFSNHPYGQQTVLGTQEHLKNPSITNIKKYYKEWYAPNNIAICMSGDLDPDQTLEVIYRYFGDLVPNPQLPELSFKPENPLMQPLTREVLGSDAENITLAWRFPGVADKSNDTLQVISQILYNGTAGLIDLNLNHQQKVLNAYCYPWEMSDYNVFMMQGFPREGQTLDEVKVLLLSELRNLCEGSFDASILEANINNFKLYRQYQLEGNRSRANMFVQSFVNGTDWADEVTQIERLSKLTKQDIMAFARKYLKDTNYAAIYKREGKDPNEMKIAKPEITPLALNRDTASLFLKEIQNTPVVPIEPVFVDFQKEIGFLQTNAGIPVLYKQNETNDLFQLIYLFDMGNNHDKALGTAAGYLEYLGTADLTPEQVKSEFYRMACSFSVSPGSERTYVTLIGLNESMLPAIQLFEKLLADAQPNTEAYGNMVTDILKKRSDAKLNQMQNFSRLVDYAVWGSQSPATHLLSAEELGAMDPQQLVDRIHALSSYKHRILYYGPASQEELLSALSAYHRVPDALKEIPAGVEFVQQETPETLIFLAPYEARQIYMAQVSNRNEKYDPAIEPQRKLYNEYFGGSMNSIVFQEMRESRGLAYSAWAGLNAPSYLKYPYTMRTQIATQNDKMSDAIRTFNDIINDMPESAAAFKLAKESMIARLRTDRIVKSGVLWAYINAQDLGQSTDSRITVFKDVQKLTLQDILSFQQKWIKGRTYRYCILGDQKDLDIEALKKIGTVRELTPAEIFGY